MGKITAGDVEKALEQIKTIRRRSYHFVKECKYCGEPFETLNDESDTCLRCTIIQDMQLPEDTLVNGNFIKLWQNGRYNNVGIEVILKEICEGVILLSPDIPRTRSTGYKWKKQNVTNESIEEYVEFLKKQLDGRFDAIVVMRYRSDGNFSVFAFRYGTKAWEQVKDESTLFKKKVIMGLMSKIIAEELDDKRKRATIQHSVRL